MFDTMFVDFENDFAVPFENDQDTAVSLKGDSSYEVHLMPGSAKDFLLSKEGQKAAYWDLAWRRTRVTLKMVFEGLVTLSLMCIVVLYVSGGFHSRVGEMTSAGLAEYGYMDALNLLGALVLFSVGSIVSYWLICLRIGTSHAPHRQTQNALRGHGALSINYRHACPYAWTIKSPIVTQTILEAITPEYRDWVFAQPNPSYAGQALLRSIDVFVHESMFHSKTPLGRDNLPPSLALAQSRNIKRDPLGGMSGALNSRRDTQE